MPRRRLSAARAQVTVAAVLSKHELNSGKWAKRQESIEVVPSTEASSFTEVVESTPSFPPLDSSSFSGTSFSTEKPSTSQVPTPTEFIELPSQSLPPPAPPVPSKPAATDPPQENVTSTQALPNPTPSSEPSQPSVDSPSASQSEVAQEPTSLTVPTPSVTRSSSTPSKTPDPELPEPSDSVPPILPSQPPSAPLPSPPVAGLTEVPTDPVASTGNPPLPVSQSPAVGSNTIRNTGAPLASVAVNNADTDEPVLASLDTSRAFATPTQLAINIAANGNTDVPLVQTFTEQVVTALPSIIDNGSTVDIPVTLITIRTRTTSVVSTGVPTAESVPSRTPSSRAAVIGGVVGGVVAFVLLGVFLFVLLWRRSRSKKSLNTDFIFAHPSPHSSSPADPFKSEPSMMENGGLRPLVLKDASIIPPSHPDGRSDPFQSPDRMGSLPRGAKDTPLDNPFDDPPVSQTPLRPWTVATRSSGGAWEQGIRASQVSMGVAV